MSMNRDIAVLIGSLRKESFTRKMAHALIELAPSQVKLEIVEIGQLPHYDQDLETANPPAQWGRIFALRFALSMAWSLWTPEYNRSVPGRPQKTPSTVGIASLWQKRLERENRPESSAHRRAPSAVFRAPTIICASRWCS